MSWGAFETRFHSWSRGPALAVIAALLALLALACWSPASGPAPKVRTAAAQHSDLQLYRDIITRVRAGENYYATTADELRKGNYPLKPFFTFRLPTHATLYAAFGERVMVALFWLLSGALMVAWWIRLRAILPGSLLAASLILIAGGLGGLLQPQTGLFHESWAALLLALMIALYRPERIWPALLAGGAALMIRELALPMILAMGGLALLDRRPTPFCRLSRPPCPLGRAGGAAQRPALARLDVDAWAAVRAEEHRQGDVGHPPASRARLGAADPVLVRLGFGPRRMGAQGRHPARRLWFDDRAARPHRYFLLGADCRAFVVRRSRFPAQGLCRSRQGRSPIFV